MKVQAQLGALLGLDGRISVTSIASFTANTNTSTETAYEQFCRDLYQVGATEDMMREKEGQILEVLRSQDMVASIGVGGSGDQEQEQEQDRERDQALEMAYKEFCENLHQMGVTEDMIGKDKILEILRSRFTVAEG